MSDSSFSEAGAAGREDMLSDLFAQMVVQHANMARMLMGRTPHPQTGEAVQDLEGARMFIDQLEMLEAKTKGNLTRDEQALLKQSLMSLRMAFVEAVESPSAAPSGGPSAPPAPTESGSGAEDKPAQSPAADSSASPAPDAESKKKFSKKY
jgi:hypothetical protein